MEWINVNDRLPDYNNNGNAITVIIYPQKINAWFAKDWLKWCKDGSRDLIEGDVTHWMPLPEPPSTPNQ